MDDQNEKPILIHTEEITLSPGENSSIAIPVPTNATLASMKLKGKCGCGGELIPHKKEPLTWICSKSHWWNRREHALLKVEASVLPKPQGSA